MGQKRSLSPRDSAPRRPFILVGLTGSIGSGKSTCARILSELGAEVIGADVLAREALAPGSAGAKAVFDRFGAAVFESPQTLTINRKALAARVFSNPSDKKALEAIVHPRVREEFLRRLQELSRRVPPPEIVVYDVPLLFESPNDTSIFDATVVVSAPADESIQRVMRRDGMTRAEVEARLANQLPIEEKERQADFVIKNSSTLEELRSAAKVVFERLIAARRNL